MLILPVVIAISFFYLLYQNNKSNKIENFGNINTNVLFEVWKKAYIQAKANDDIDKIQIVRDGKIYRINDLNVTQKELFKLMLLYKTKKDARRFSDSMSATDVELVNKIIRETDEKIAECKINLYNLQGKDTHNFDKFFLENLDVYFFN